MWHKLSLFGKVLLVLVGFGFGLAVGYSNGKKEASSGNNIEVNVDGKIKDGSDVNVNIEGNDQNQKKEDKKFLGIF